MGIIELLFEHRGVFCRHVLFELELNLVLHRSINQFHQVTQALLFEYPCGSNFAPVFRLNLIVLKYASG